MKDEQRSNKDTSEQKEKILYQLTFSSAIEAVNPDVSMATTSGSGLGTGRACFEGI